jgi:hypothetical protein
MALRAATPRTIRVAGARRAIVASRVRVVRVDAAKRSVGDLKRADLEGKRVFVRCDLNVPLDKELNITDDTRIRAAVDTLKYLSDNGAKVIVTSHLVSFEKERIFFSPAFGVVFWGGAALAARGFCRRVFGIGQLTTHPPSPPCTDHNRAAPSRAPRTSEYSIRSDEGRRKVSSRRSAAGDGGSTTKQ